MNRWPSEMRSTSTAIASTACVSCASWVETSPGVYCGRLLTKREALAMSSLGITGVLDLNVYLRQCPLVVDLDTIFGD